MKKIVVASTNPVKINATLRAFQKMFPSEKLSVEGVSVPSGVSDQPFSDQETFTGADNRLNRIKEQRPGADYWVGLEGGIEDLGDEMRTVVWIIIHSTNQTGQAKAGSFYLPHSLAELIRGGMEMGHADDQIFGTTNSKQASGAIGLLTNGVLDRTALYENGIILALVPFLNPHLYKS